MCEYIWTNETLRVEIKNDTFKCGKYRQRLDIEAKNIFKYMSLLIDLNMSPGMTSKK